jgi:hypothetical protein
MDSSPHRPWTNFPIITYVSSSVKKKEVERENPTLHEQVYQYVMDMMLKYVMYMKPIYMDASPHRLWTNCLLMHLEV